MIDNPEAAFHAYMRVFDSLDPEAALPFYHLPSIFIAPQGVFLVPDTDTARTLLSQVMGQLPGQSYHRPKVAGLTVRQLSPALATCAGTIVRVNTNGEDIARLGFIYTMRNVGSWRIVVAALHEPIGA